MSLLKINGLCRNFGGLKAVCDLEVHIKEGSITALIGPNGAGKTTAFNLVTGLTSVSSGTIHFHDHDITRLQPYKIAALGIARTFQNIRIFANMTVLENVMVGLHTRSSKGIFAAALKLPGTGKEERRIRDEAMKQLDFSGIAEYAHINAGNLAFGQQRALEIARALASKPEMLLLDEPAAGLNSQETLILGEMIGNIRDLGITVFLVEHDMELVMSISDKVFVLNNGILIAEGSPSEVQCNPEVIKAYLGDDE